MENIQRFIDLRQKIINKQQFLSNIKMPSSHFSKQGLRSGVMGRVVRKENKRFLGEVKKQKIELAKQKMAIDKYLSRMGSIPTPKIRFIKEVPKLRVIRGSFNKQIRRRKKR